MLLTLRPPDGKLFPSTTLFRFRESRISFDSRAGFKLLAISAIWARLVWRSTMFEELIYVSHVYRQTRTGVNWRAAVLERTNIRRHARLSGSSIHVLR